VRELVSVRDELERRLREVPGLARRPSRYGHTFAYFAGGREIAHFHRDGRVDVRLTRELIRERVSERALDGRVRTRGPSADWVSVPLEGVKDLPLVLSLVEDAVRANA
jgi:Family of unknown function (DUF5519)